MAKRPGDVVRARMRAFRSAQYQAVLTGALKEAAQLVQTEAQLSITRGAVSGLGHVPSAPGEPPNNDTGVLANNIETTMPSSRVARVTSSAPYASDLEFGTSKMAARPYFRPARDKMAPEAKALLAERVNLANKLFKGK